MTIQTTTSCEIFSCPTAEQLANSVVIHIRELDAEERAWAVGRAKSYGNKINVRDYRMAVRYVDNKWSGAFECENDTEAMHLARKLLHEEVVRLNRAAV